MPVDRGANRQPTRGRSVGAGMGESPAPAPAYTAPPAPPPMPAYQPPPPMNVPQIQAPQIQAPQVEAPPINGGGQGPSPGLPGLPGGHVAQSSPELMEYLARVKARLDAPVDTTREVNQLGQQIAGFAQGARNNAMGDAARRGVLGVSGAEGQVQDDIGNVAAGNFARGAESIALQRMRDKDAMLMGAQGAFAEPGRQNLADRGLGIQAAGQAGSLDLQRQRMTLDAQLANANMANDANRFNVANQIAAQQAAAQQQMQMYAMMMNLYR